MPRGTPGLSNYMRGHVEGHAAALMRLGGIDRAELYINKVPCPICAQNLPYALPPEAELVVYGPNRYIRTFKGLPE